MTANPLLLFGSGGWIRTNDLWVMSPTSYQTAPPRAIYLFEKQVTKSIPFKCQEIFFNSSITSKTFIFLSMPFMSKVSILSTFTES